MDLKSLFSVLEKYPFSATCFMPYLDWLTQQSDIDLKDNGLIVALSEPDAERLKLLEALLIRSREILGLTETDFLNVFGFSNDLLTIDPEKVHDILAEPILVVNLSENGFLNIKKLPKFIKHEGSKISVADFSAQRSDKKYAIELKTVRMENKPKPVPGKPTGNAAIPSWWTTMFRNNLITKIEDKKRRVIKQLNNTKTHFACDYSMLAFYTRRLGPSTLMETEDYVNELTDIKKKYEEIDYIFFKDYFGQVIVIPN